MTRTCSRVAVALAAALIGAAVFVTAAAQQDESGPQEIAPVQAAGLSVAVMQGLDKITARISTFEAPLDQPVKFGTLEIVARACRKQPPEEPPETAAFLEISEVRPDEPTATLFTGWMFASSPALSALEHPVYDVWVIDCRQSRTGSE